MWEHCNTFTRPCSSRSQPTLLWPSSPLSLLLCQMRKHLSSLLFNFSGSTSSWIPSLLLPSWVVRGFSSQVSSCMCIFQTSPALPAHWARVQLSYHSVSPADQEIWSQASVTIVHLSLTYISRIHHEHFKHHTIQISLIGIQAQHLSMLCSGSWIGARTLEWTWRAFWRNQGPLLRIWYLLPGLCLGPPHRSVVVQSLSLSLFPSLDVWVLYNTVPFSHKLQCSG